MRVDILGEVEEILKGWPDLLQNFHLLRVLGDSTFLTGRMNPRVQSVKPHPDYTITLVFTNGEVKRFDVKPYLHIGIFQELKDMSVFNSVRPLLGSVQWENGQDFCPDTLYMDSVPEMNLAQTVAGEKAVA